MMKHFLREGMSFLIPFHQLLLFFYLFENDTFELFRNSTIPDEGSVITDNNDLRNTGTLNSQFLVQ